MSNNSLIMEFLKKLWFIPALGLLVGASLVLVYPLWWLAQYSADLYSLIMLVLIGAGAVTILIFRLRKKAALLPKGQFWKKVFLMGILKGTAVFLAVVFGVISIIAFSAGNFIFGPGAAAVGCLFVVLFKILSKTNAKKVQIPEDDEAT